MVEAEVEGELAFEAGLTAEPGMEGEVDMTVEVKV